MYVYRGMEIVNWLPDILAYFQHPCQLPIYFVYSSVYRTMSCMTGCFHSTVYTVYIYVCVHLFQPNFTCIYVRIPHHTFLYYYHQPPLPLSGMGMMDDVFISAKPYTKVCIYTHIQNIVLISFNLACIGVGHEG